MFSKISEAFELLKSNLNLIAAVLCTIWFPANLLLEYYYFNSSSHESVVEYMRISMWMEALVAPLSAASLIVLLAGIKRDEPVSYKAALSEGLRHWGAVFKANFFAGLWVLLALFAFIIPGIVLAVRYSLIDSVVVLEELGAAESRRRSNEMTDGIALEIFGVWLLLFTGFVASSFLGGFPLAFFPMMDNFVVSALIDTVLDLIYSMVTIALFLYYWEVRTADADWADDGLELGTSGT